MGPTLAEAEAETPVVEFALTRLSSQKVNINGDTLSLRRPILLRLRLKALMKITMATQGFPNSNGTAH